MKAILNDGTEYQVSSVFMQAENQLGISFHGIVGGYDKFRESLTATSTKTIKVYTTDIEYTPYEEFTKVIPKGITEREDNTLEVFVVFEREDALVQRVKTLETMLGIGVIVE